MIRIARILCLSGFVFVGLAGSQRAVTGGEQGQHQRFSRTSLHMGVEFQIVLYAADQKQAEAALDRAFARIAELDKKLSDYDPESELSKLSDTTKFDPRDGKEFATKPIEVSDDLWTVLAEAQRVSAESTGAFDVTIGPLTKLWRRARRQKELPDAKQLEEARRAVGYESLKLDRAAQTVQLLKPNMRLDLGGIAKGYAVDEALGELAKYGITRALARGSGDIAAGDPPPNEKGWRVGIAPLDPDQAPTRFLILSRQAVSTSGDSRQHLVVDGKRYSHLIDPKTGLGISGRRSVTVIAPKGMLADALDSAICILGPEKGAALAEKYGVALYMVVENESGERQEVVSPQFKQFEEAKTQPE